MSHNQFQFIGNITRDVESRHGDSGGVCGILDIAVDDVWYDSDQNKQERTDFFRLKTFGRLAENAAKYLGKGSKVFVEGRIRNTRYEQDGQTVYGQDFVVEKLKFLDTRAPVASNHE